MQIPPESEGIFLHIGFRSPENFGNLRTIELFGIPGKRLANGKCVVNEKAQRFFDDLIVRIIFRESRRLPDCNFQSLKIWLYDTEVRDEDRGYYVPPIDKRDLVIRSNIGSSKLNRIYILDNKLAGREYDFWRKMCEDLFSPLFIKFIAPPELSLQLADNSLVELVKEGLQSIIDSVDQYGKMKQNSFFNALIIQID